MFGVVARSLLARDLDHLHGNQLEPAPLEPPNNFPDQPALHAVGFDEDQRSLHRAQGPDVSVGFPSKKPSWLIGQIRTSAFPRMDCSVIGPNVRESLEWLRLSPMTKYSPVGMI